jgi:uncharacterized protein (UPF0261 family)
VAWLPVPEHEVVRRGIFTATTKNKPRGEYIKTTIEQYIAIMKRLVQSSSINGIVPAGGSSETSLATALMREACHVGFPKVMLSTLVSGEIKPFVEETDVTTMYN